jgi:hypothetical protein
MPSTYLQIIVGLQIPERFVRTTNFIHDSVQLLTVAYIQYCYWMSAASLDSTILWTVLCLIWSHSLVGIATGYGLDGGSSIPGRDRFSSSS